MAESSPSVPSVGKMTECVTYRCNAERLPHVSFCYEHVPRYEIPNGVSCPECGSTDYGTIHDDMYYCRNESECGELFDPRRTDYLERLRAKPGAE